MPDHYFTLDRPGITVGARLGDQLLARSAGAVVLREVYGDRTLEPVHYFPAEDVEFERLLATSTRTHCPIKGDASYWRLRDGAAEGDDIAWSYLDPIDGSDRIRGMVAFAADRVTIGVG